jgi:hypothetical protein
MYFFLFLALLLVGAYLYILLVRKYGNPYILNVYMGVKGSGKSTYGAYLIYNYLKKGVDVYTNIPVDNRILLDFLRPYKRKIVLKSMEIVIKKGKIIPLKSPLVKELLPLKIVKVRQKPKLPFGSLYPLQRDYYHQKMNLNSVVIIDEAGLLHDNRSFSTFPRAALEWYKYQRHNRLIVHLFSQSYDIDKKIRDLADFIFVIQRYMIVFIFARRLRRKLVVLTSEQTGSGESKISEDFVKLLMPRLIFLPKWCKLQDSFSSLEEDLADRKEKL